MTTTETTTLGAESSSQLGEHPLKLSEQNPMQDENILTVNCESTDSAGDDDDAKPLPSTGTIDNTSSPESETFNALMNVIEKRFPMLSVRKDLFPTVTTDNRHDNTSSSADSAQSNPFTWHLVSGEPCSDHQSEFICLDSDTDEDKSSEKSADFSNSANNSGAAVTPFDSAESLTKARRILKAKRTPIRRKSQPPPEETDSCQQFISWTTPKQGRILQ